jgi:hypothetical protein
MILHLQVYCKLYYIYKCTVKRLITLEGKERLAEVCELHLGVHRR